MLRSLSFLIASAAFCCLFPACSGDPNQAGLPTGPIAYGLPDGPIAYGLPSCSSPPASAAGCKSATACDDHNPCTVDACVGGQCSYRLVEAGAACGQGASCDDEGCCNDE